VTTAIQSALSGLASIVGESRVVRDPAICANFAVDGMTPACVLYPASAEEVAAVLQYAAEYDLAVIPCRNATKLDVGNVPRRYDVALSLKEMSRVWHYEPADLTVTAEAGMEFGDFQHFVSRDGLWLPLDPPGGPRSSLGGILATNASGPLRLAYGAPRDMLLGMKIATIEGKVIKTGGRVVKNVAGYDVAKLLIGSYGTLGVIVEASIKLFPLPSARATFVLPTGTLGIARDLRRRILCSPLQPLRLVLLDAMASNLALAGTPLARKVEEPELWVEMGGSARVIERCARDLEELGKAAGAPVRRLEAEDADLAWARFSDFRSWLPEAFPGVAILKVVLPDAASEEFLSRAQQETETDNVRLAGFTQLGVGTLRLCLLEAESATARIALIRRLRKAAQDLGGALVVEHCHWDIKSRVDVWGPTGDDFALMAKMKAVWDPKGALAPGRFVGGL
jgi:glycolate oxidase FAD binding subunit